MISVELNTLRIAFKANPDPTLGDSYFDFIKPDQNSLNGFALDSYTVGEEAGYSEKYKTNISVITIAGAVQIASAADLNARIKALNFYFSKSRELLKSFRGNIPASGDGSWLGGRGAVLTFQPYGGDLRFWYVMDGEIIRNGSIAEDTTRGLVQGITVKIYAREMSRGSRHKLLNMVIDGDLDAENGDCLTTLPMGWYSPSVSTINTHYGFFATTYNICYENLPLASSNLCPGGRRALSFQNGAGSYTIYTNGVSLNFQDNSNSKPFVISFWIYNNITQSSTGQFKVGIQQWNGSAWSDYTSNIDFYNPKTGNYDTTPTPGNNLLTINANDTNYTNNQHITASYGFWKRYEFGTDELIGTYRLAFTTSNIGSTSDYTKVFKFTGVSWWLDPTTFPLAPVEDCAGNWAANAGSIRLYNIQGDTAASAKITCYDHQTSNFSNSQVCYLVGMQQANYSGAYTPAVDSPLKAQDLLSSSTLTNTDSSGQIIGGKYSYPISNTVGGLTSFSGSISHALDRVPRRYLVFAYYAANDSAAIAQVSLTVNKTNQIFPKALAQTYTGGTNPTASQFRLACLGEMWYPKNPNTSIEATDPFWLSAGNWTATLTTGTNLSGKVALNGLMMLPFEQFGLWEEQFPSDITNNLSVFFTNEGNLPAVSDAYSTNNYRLTGMDIQLKPGDNIMSVIYLSNKDNTTSPPLLTPAFTSTSGGVTAGDNQPYRVWGFEYNPHYLLDV